MNIYLFLVELIIICRYFYFDIIILLCYNYLKCIKFYISDHSLLYYLLNFKYFQISCRSPLFSLIFIFKKYCWKVGENIEL